MKLKNCMMCRVGQIICVQVLMKSLMLRNKEEERVHGNKFIDIEKPRMVRYFVSFLRHKRSKEKE